MACGVSVVVWCGCAPGSADLMDWPVECGRSQSGTRPGDASEWSSRRPSAKVSEEMCTFPTDTIYGRRRKVRWKEVVCLWRVLGHDVPVKAVVAEVKGYKKRFTVVSSAV